MIDDFPNLADSELEFSILKDHIENTGPLKYMYLDKFPRLADRLDYLGERRLIFQPTGEPTVISITDEGRRVYGDGSDRDLLRYHFAKTPEDQSKEKVNLPPIQDMEISIFQEKRIPPKVDFSKYFSKKEKSVVDSVLPGPTVSA